MSVTDLCARCGADCGMSDCPECGGCENTGPGGTDRVCPVCGVCPVCNGYGMVLVPELDGEGMYETACPEPVHDDPPVTT